jgi:hypothetical protein
VIRFADIGLLPTKQGARSWGHLAKLHQLTGPLSSRAIGKRRDSCSQWLTGSHGKHEFCAVQLQTGVVTGRPNGPLSSIVICRKREAAVRITGEFMQSFADTKIDPS